MAEHEERVDLSYLYFREKNLSDDEAKALAFSLSFYTGTKSETCNRGASLIARTGNGEVIEPRTANEINEAAIILYYLVKSLSYIPFYWGYVTRACQLTFHELSMYTPGRLITWIQFSSSKKGKKVVNNTSFKERNTLFKIFSLTGRSIKQFSNYPEEDEVLFLPHTTFLVFNRKTFSNQQKNVIYMRQVELGLCEWSVLWVDDEIFSEDWEKKQHMEYVAASALDMNVHFIAKSSTDSALSFLQSVFGQRLKNCDTFRIVTDMNRRNEVPVHNAGARLIKAVRQMGFKNKCLIFTSNQKRAQQILNSELISKERQSVFVSTKIEDLRNFVNFDRVMTSAQESTTQKSKGSANDSNASTTTIPSAAVYQSTVGNNAITTSINAENEMMHNRENTDISMLMNNCYLRNLTDSPHNCVLLTTGSLNPVHPLHLQNRLHVKQYLENEHQPPWNVIAGYVSPTHDKYVRSKLGDLHWIPAKDRCQLCKQVIEFETSEISSWVDVSRGESEWKEGFVDFDPVTKSFRDFLNITLVDQEKLLKYPLHVVYVCGLDHYNKCADVERMVQQENILCAVVYRVGYDEKKINSSLQSSGVIYIPLLEKRAKLEHVSSTQIRRYFQNPTGIATNIEKNIYPVV
ncbi:hypothetical protein I4U23_023693 [Adineta vaga]|nr:hypothetical protein I4U23_023693 [Adineta vaga]